jgi:diguanylate cyclase (GGDEF)-like protein
VTGALHYIEPYSVYQDLLQRTLRQFFLSQSLLAAFLIVPLWLFLNRRVLRPVRQIVEANNALANGRPEGMYISVPTIPGDEIGDIMRSRNNMLTRLEASEAELRQRLKELSALNATAVLLSQSTLMEEVLNRILDKVLEITGAGAAGVSLLEPDKNMLVIRAQRGFSPEWLAQEAHRPASCLCGSVIQEDKPLCLEGMDPADPRVTRPACAREGFRSLCIVPLRAEGEALGVLSLHSREARPHTAQERDLLSAIGSQIGVALSNIRLYQETQRLSVTDALTGLRNRRALDERLQEELLRAQRYHHPLSVIMADLDHFKNYNDRHGHPAGDVILRQVASLLQSHVRETDFVARYGGEEFVALLPETAKDSGLEVAEKIRAAVEAACFPHAETQPGGRLTISLGVATFPEDLAEAHNLISKADEALYRAKRAGRDRVCSA